MQTVEQIERKNSPLVTKKIPNKSFDPARVDTKENKHLEAMLKLNLGLTTCNEDI